MTRAESLTLIREELAHMQRALVAAHCEMASPADERLIDALIHVGNALETLADIEEHDTKG